MIIDFHTHAFSDKIVKKAVKVLVDNSGGINPVFDGTITGLLNCAGVNGIDYCVLLNIATNERQMKVVNDFAIEANGGRIISFGSVYPVADSAVDELYRIHSAGLKGIKLHPAYQGFYPDDDRAMKVYEKAAELGLITVFHAGTDIGIFEPNYSAPERIANALPAFKNAPVAAAHFGGYMQWYDVEKHLVGKNIYFDTSYCYSKMPFQQARRIVSDHGADKILFGSDLPWSAAADEMRFVASLGLSEDENKLIFGGNAARLLRIKA